MDVPRVTQRGLGVGLMLLLLVGSFLSGRATISPTASADDGASTLVLGPWGYYALRDVTMVLVAAPEVTDLPPPIHVFVVRFDDGDLVALDGRDPYWRCFVEWNASAALFVDMCHQNQFTRTGEPVVGPPGKRLQPLERFGLRVLPNDDLELDFEGDAAAEPPSFSSRCESPDEPCTASPE